MTLIFKYKNICYSPNKMRRILFYMKGKLLTNTIDDLDFILLKSSFIFKKLLKNIFHNICQNNLNVEKYIIKNILVDKGRILKKRFFSAKGRSSFLKKRFSNVEIQICSL